MFHGVFKGSHAIVDNGLPGVCVITTRRCETYCELHNVMLEIVPAMAFLE